MYMHVVERIVLGKENVSKWNCFLFSVLFFFVLIWSGVIFFFFFRIFFLCITDDFWKVVFDHLKGLFTQNCFIIYSSSLKKTFFCETQINIFGRMLGTKELNSTRTKKPACVPQKKVPYNHVTSWLTTILWFSDGETHQLLMTVSQNCSSSSAM